MAKKKSERANGSKMDRVYYRLLSPLAPAPISPLPLSEGLRKSHFTQQPQSLRPGSSCWSGQGEPEPLLRTAREV